MINKILSIAIAIACACQIAKAADKIYEIELCESSSTKEQLKTLELVFHSRHLPKLEQVNQLLKGSLVQAASLFESEDILAKAFLSDVAILEAKTYLYSSNEREIKIQSDPKATEINMQYYSHMLGVDQQATTKNGEQRTFSKEMTGQTKSNETIQEQRKEFIAKLIKRGVFKKIEVPGDLPRVWVSPLFNALDYEQKSTFVEVVYAYYAEHSNNPDLMVVKLYDSKTGNKIGTYSLYGGGLKLKQH